MSHLFFANIYDMGFISSQFFTQSKQVLILEETFRRRRRGHFSFVSCVFKTTTFSSLHDLTILQMVRRLLSALQSGQSTYQVVTLQKAAPFCSSIKLLGP